MKEKTCCFLGHRKIDISDFLKIKLYEAIKKLIIENNIDIFLFGNKSQFNDVCYDIVSELRKIYPHIKRVYVRAKFPYISEDYKSYLLERYEETYFPSNALNAGRASYIKRNANMIDNSTYCIIYFDENYTPNTKNISGSGTKTAYNYAVKKEKKIINMFR